MIRASSFGVVLLLSIGCVPSAPPVEPIDAGLGREPVDAAGRDLGLGGAPDVGFNAADAEGVTDAGLAADAVARIDAGMADTGVEADAGNEADAGFAPDARPARDAGPFMPNPRLAGLADETALDLGRFECTPVGGEDPDLCRRVTDYSGLVYDPRGHRLLLFGGGHSTTMSDSIHAFDLGGMLSWTDLYEPTPCGSMNNGNLDGPPGAWISGAGGPFPRPVSTHTYDMLAVSPIADEFIIISRNFSGGYCNTAGNDIGGRVAHYDLSAGQWTFSPTARGSGNYFGGTLPGTEVDPISHQIVILGGGGLQLYDPATKELSPVWDQIATEGYANHLVYYPPSDKFYFFARETPVKVYSLALDRADPSRSVVQLLATQGPTSMNGEPGYDYDAVNEVIGGGVQDGQFYTFDPRTLTWTEHPMNGGTVGSMAFHALAYDPVNNVFVFVTDYPSGQKTWAYRVRM